MRNVGRKLAFVLAATKHGTMIVNRLDYRMVGPSAGIGVGFQILETAAFDPVEVEMALQLIELRRRYYGDGVVAIDCGANIGVHTIEWATAMTGWGSVIAVEAQERLYYALAGNIAINNCFNAIAMHAAVASETGSMKIPTPNYLTRVELRQPGAAPARRQRIHRPADRLFGGARPSRSEASRSMRWPSRAST